MYDSLIRLAGLPDDTPMYCAHEYTLENIAFALKAEPNNAELLARHAQVLALCKRDQATLPVSMGTEKATNPFLRCDLSTLTVAASQHVKKALKPGVETFAAVRAWRDEA
jgi:hydroxyacylglutathione hydrolase